MQQHRVHWQDAAGAGGAAGGGGGVAERSGGSGSSSGNQLFLLQRKRSSSFSGVDESNPNLKIKVCMCMCASWSAVILSEQAAAHGGMHLAGLQLSCWGLCDRAVAMVCRDVDACHCC
jgi:hypothetical protein